MEFFKHNTNIDFMAQRKWAAIFSVVLFIVSMATLAVNGLNWGLDFTGGTQVQLNFPGAADLNLIRSNLEQAGFKDAVVTSYGTSRDVLVTLVPSKTQAKATVLSNDAKDVLVSQVLQSLPNAKVVAINYIGPQVGNEMVTKGWLAIAVALLGTMIYIAARFEKRFAVASTVALIHDPVIILGIFSLFHLEFNLITLAAVLTVIGYSLNDTIVIFDRVREDFRKLRKATAIEVMNQAINQTLSRTIMTSALTLTVVLALFFLGGSLLHGFSLALIIGIIVGTYSSIYVAGALSIALGLSRQHLLPPNKEALDDRP
ncbi:MAG: protein-export membrane protein SecF [Gammaproteobacteria bacterium RIFCSPHIGHO2_12_FULL_45_9]|nr:MAG: protein-export membrane protein SecF [Gammaproteobacteria bacterium RIFCSPHIGHO2_12_FULL_45_9]